MRFIPLLLLSFLGCLAEPEVLKTRAEQSNYEETSRYEDVMRVVQQVAKHSDVARLEVFGRSEEGRALPLLILADPPVATPREALISGKPVIFVFANIHGGEVEGKESLQDVAQRIAYGNLRPLLRSLVILLAPIYNADGNERFSLKNRTAQNGPIGGVGERHNAKGFDLNRDYIKMEAAETEAMIRLLNRWDPHITVDLHTTNGSYHGYHLTYSIPLHPAIDAGILSYSRGTMMPALRKAMLDARKFRTYYYGNFSRDDANRSWRAFDHRPRIGQNYVGFRNRLTILSEAYSYLDFKRRVEVTTAFVEEILNFAAARGGEIRRLTEAADRNAVRRGMAPPAPQGIAFEMRPLPQRVEILMGKVVKKVNSRSGTEMTAMVEDKFTPVRMLDYGVFAATKTVPAAWAYLFPPSRDMELALRKLIAHGIAVEELTDELTAEVQTFYVSSVQRAATAFQGHNEVRLHGEYRTEKITFPKATILVRAAQPLRALAFTLLEPESDDGLAAWNFLDSVLQAGKAYPIYKLLKSVEVSSRLRAD